MKPLTWPRGNNFERHRAVERAVSADNPLASNKRIKTGYNGRQKRHRMNRTAARRQIKELLEATA